MDDWSAFDDILSAEALYGSEIPPARPDATFTLESLPVELLQNIADYSKNKSILSLMRVNRLLYSVALRNFYSNVYLSGEALDRHFKSLDATLPIEKLLSSLSHKKYGVLGGLLRAKHHLAVLRMLNIISFPSPFGSGHVIFNRILRYIIENANSIHSIDLPWANNTPSTVFEGLVVPLSLDTLKSGLFRNDLSGVILRSCHLRSLRMYFQCATATEWQTVAGQMSDTLRHLQCSFHVPNGQWDETAADLESFASKLTHLEELEFGFCECVHAVQLTELPIKYYSLLAAAIPSLTTLTIVDRRTGSFQRRTDLSNELSLVSALSHGNTNLREINITYTYRPRTSNYDGDAEYTIKWAGASPESTAVNKTRDVKGQIRLWTPAPHLRSRCRSGTICSEMGKLCLVLWELVGENEVGWNEVLVPSGMPNHNRISPR